MTDFDLVIRNGLVHDGAAECELREADVAVAGDRVARIAPEIPPDRARVLDAKRCIVGPGFVDVHAHSDQSALTFPGAESKVCDGVTTEVNGNCGLTMFPVLNRARPIEGGEVLVEDWDNLEWFLEQVEQVGTAVNRAYLMGHGALRTGVMGLDDRPPSGAELALMQSLIAAAMDQGALGLSSGLAYAPGCFARVEELAALCRVVARRNGIYATHIRNEGDEVVESVREALAVARASGVKLQIGHLKTLGRSNWAKVRDLERLLTAARREGIDVTADRYPYLACSTGLRAMFSLWLMDGGPEKAVTRLRDPVCRRRLLEERSTEFGGEMLWESVMVASVRSEENRHWVGHPIAGIARQRGKSPQETALDLLAEEQTHVGVVVFAMSEENLAAILNWPFVMVASDSGARDFETEKGRSLPHPRAFGTFSRVLGRLVRQDRALDLTTAVHKMTAMPARRYGLRDRGVLREGSFADITVFDPDLVLDRATFEDPFQASEGIRHVLVNGVPVLEDGELTRRRPGKVLRKGVDVS